ncbi:MAG: hypothetical protein CMN76_04970 [Spirochaetaceae bacterium]|nr:hypothetical protein [Spirochaetaceae bacterium]
MKVLASGFPIPSGEGVTDKSIWIGKMRWAPREALSMCQSQVIRAFYSLVCLLVLLIPVSGKAESEVHDLPTLQYLNLASLEGNGPTSALQAPHSFHSYLDRDNLSVGEIRNLHASRWELSERKDINHGYTSAVLWIRILVNNNTESPLKVLLEEDFTLIRTVEAFVFSPERTGVVEKSKVDRTLKFEQRPIVFSNPVMPLTIPPGRHAIYVRLASDMDMIAAMQLWAPNDFQESTIQRQMIFGILYGSILLMALYNGLLWLSLRDKTYLFYSLYCLAFEFYFLAYYGHGAQFLWGAWPWFEQRAVPIVMSVHIGLLASEFFRLYLSVNRTTPVQLRIVRGIQIFSVGLLAASLLLPPATVIRVFPLYAISGIVIMAGVSITRYVQGFKPASIAIVAFLILWVAGIFSSLRSLGVVPYNNATMYGVAFGNVAELLLLSLGLGYRLRRIRAEGRVAGERSQSLVRLLEELPYAVVLRYENDRILAYANRAARDLYPNQEIRDWKSAGIQAFRQDNADRWIAVHHAPLQIEDRQAELQIHWEVTAEMEGRLELEEKHARTLEAKRQADENRKSQDEFLQSMTVEIRRPMAAVLQAADVLQSLDGTDEQQSLAGILLRSSSTLVNLLNDLADLSRIESRGLPIHKIPFSPQSLFRDAYRLFEPNARTRGLRLELHCSDVPELIQDPVRINQVISNLLNNAIKFSETGAIVISATYEEGWLEVRISDQGPGIAMELQDKLFQRFEQLHSATYRRFGGTGLGLAICKGVVEALDGTIGCESEPGKGSTFWFRLPAERVASETTEKEDSQASGSGIKKVGLAISTDDASAMLEHQIRLQGMEILRLDPQYPGFNVSDLDLLIAENPPQPLPPDLPIIAWSMTGRTEEALADAEIIPPISRDDLISTMQKAFKGQQERRNG